MFSHSSSSSPPLLHTSKSNKLHHSKCDNPALANLSTQTGHRMIYIYGIIRVIRVTDAHVPVCDELWYLSCHNRHEPASDPEKYVLLGSIQHREQLAAAFTFEVQAKPNELCMSCVRGRRRTYNSAADCYRRCVLLLFMLDVRTYVLCMLRVVPFVRCNNPKSINQQHHDDDDEDEEALCSCTCQQINRKRIVVCLRCYRCCCWPRTWPPADTNEWYFQHAIECIMHGWTLVPFLFSLFFVAWDWLDVVRINNTKQQSWDQPPAALSCTLKVDIYQTPAVLNGEDTVCTNAGPWCGWRKPIPAATTGKLPSPRWQILEELTRIVRLGQLIGGIRMEAPRLNKLWAPLIQGTIGLHMLPLVTHINPFTWRWREVRSSVH